MSNKNEEPFQVTKRILPIIAIAFGAVSLVLLSIDISLGADVNDTLCNVSHVLGFISFISGFLSILLIKKELGIFQKVIWIGFASGILVVICHILFWIRNFLMFMIHVQ